MNDDSAGVSDNWEKAETSSGILYYINHKGKKTQWENPKFTAALNAVNECNSIKYAAYRTAAKICILQKVLGLDKVRLGIISGVFQQHRIQVLENCLQLDYSELEAILADIYFAASKESRLKLYDYDVDRFTELTLNFLISVFDKNRDGSIQVIGIKVALVSLCCSRLQEKYQYLFYQLADHNSCLSKRKLKLLLEQFVFITDYLYESLSFSSSLIPDTLESCFENESHGPLGISEENFMSWVLKEPQLLVWLSTFYRLRAAENVTHSVRCAVCRLYPIKGLRYRCLHCISYDQCQMCFFHGRVSKRHKLKHPMQEYSWQTSHKEATLSFLKALVNRLCGNTSRLQYLPAQPCDTNSANIDSISSSSISNSTISTAMAQLSPDLGKHQKNKFIQTVCTNNDCDEYDDDDEVEGGKYVTIEYAKACTDDSHVPSIDSTLQPQNELQSIINKLEDENRQLELDIKRLCGLDQGRVGRTLKEHRALVEAQVRRLKILKQHLQSIVPKAVQSTPIAIQNNAGLTVYKSPKLSPIRGDNLKKESSDFVASGYQSFDLISKNNDDYSSTELTFGCLSTWLDSVESNTFESRSGYSNWFSNAGVPLNPASPLQSIGNRTKFEEQKQIDELQQGLDNILVKLQNMLASNFSSAENENFDENNKV